MLLLALLASVQAPAAPPPSSAVRAESRVTVRIVRGARVERGRSGEPHSRGRAIVSDPGGERQVIPLVEFQ
jgi:hypothetical protein